MQLGQYVYFINDMMGISRGKITYIDSNLVYVDDNGNDKFRPRWEVKEKEQDLIDVYISKLETLQLEMSALRRRR